MGDGVEDALDAAAEAESLLVALDFDGTLAPFTERPEDSRPLPAARDALDALARLPRTTVAVISGRPLDFLRTAARMASRPSPLVALSTEHSTTCCPGVTRSPGTAA